MTTITTEQFIKLLDEKLEEKFEQKLTPLNVMILDMKSKVEEAMELVKFVNAKYDELNLKVEALEKEKKTIAADNKILKMSIKDLERSVVSLGEACNDLDQYGRRDCIEISGIPAPGPGQSECLNDIIGKVGLLIGAEINSEDISICHRLPQNKGYKGKRKDPLIIVKFVRRDVKEKFYRSRGNLRFKSTKDLGYSVENHIYVAESLTERNKDLFRCCLNAKKEKGHKFIWTSNGKIYLRKDGNSAAIYIKSKHDLGKIQSTNG